jgi:hypothetical protein
MTKHTHPSQPIFNDVLRRPELYAKRASKKRSRYRAKQSNVARQGADYFSEIKTGAPRERRRKSRVVLRAELRLVGPQGQDLLDTPVGSVVRLKARLNKIRKGAFIMTILNFRRVKN